MVIAVSHEKAPKTSTMSAPLLQEEIDPEAVRVVDNALDADRCPSALKLADQAGAASHHVGDPFLRVAQLLAPFAQHGAYLLHGEHFRCAQGLGVWPRI